MITLDKYIGMKADIYSNVDDRTIAGWCRKWESAMLGFKRLDSICLTENDLSRLVGPLETMDEPSADYLIKPALPEFELTTAAPVPMVGKNVIRFKRTILPKGDLIIGTDGKMQMEYDPIIDAYISFSDENRTDSVVTLFSLRIDDGDGNELLSGTAGKEFWRLSDPKLLYTIQQDEDGYREFQRNIKLSYIAIQRAMYEKPELFVTMAATPKASATADTKRNSHKRKNKVSVAKKIYLNREEMKRYGVPSRHMTCPCWGVVGHWRTYRKTGKQVWIEPYRKGKKRNDPTAYQPKEYELPKEELSLC